MRRLEEIAKNVGKYFVGIDLIEPHDTGVEKISADFPNFVAANYINAMHLVNLAYSYSNGSIKQGAINALVLEAAKFAMNQYVRHYKQRASQIQGEADVI